MEQPSTRIPQRKVRRGADVPRPSAPVGQRPGAAAPRTRPGSPPSLLRRLPRPRLTALGSGLLTALAMLGAGTLDARLLGGSPRVYGVLFVLASAACALWVRPVDLMTAPVSVPIAFAVGAVPLSDGTSGLGGRVMSLVTLLSLNAAWLYAGTLLAGLIALVRRVALIRERRRERLRQRRQRPSRPPRSPRCSPGGRGRFRP
ncbi:membrane protein [Streptomyces mashuensis]|uniref:Membrane protein n=1 Tax=Streptomyces mashuensis TaxID=33904 RepID=A0A919B7I9_9ACTN|nr:DUF6542 domain-containing protein [Streptomyces mashuensis]GHF60680.1 membrane protein [Streptomyces mashuensis]